MRRIAAGLLAVAACRAGAHSAAPTTAVTAPPPHGDDEVDAGDDDDDDTAPLGDCVLGTYHVDVVSMNTQCPFADTFVALHDFELAARTATVEANDALAGREVFDVSGVEGKACSVELSLSEDSWKQEMKTKTLDLDVDANGVGVTGTFVVQNLTGNCHDDYTVQGTRLPPGV